MPDYGDEPFNPLAILPLILALISLILTGGLVLLMDAVALESKAAGGVN